MIAEQRGQPGLVVEETAEAEELLFHFVDLVGHVGTLQKRQS